MDEPFIYLLDDDKMMRRSLELLLRSGGYKVRTFAHPEELLACDPPSRPGCLILDMQMPGKDGLEVQEQIVTRGWLLPIIFITAYGTVPITVQALKSGAMDLLTKPFNDTALLDAVARALKSSREALRKRTEKEEVAALLDTLTPREYEVLRWLIAGKLNKQIAALLGTTERTIKAHRGSVMKKLEVVSIAELVWMAEKAGIQPAG